MPHGGGGSFGGGDSGSGFSSSFEHGRSSGGSFDTFSSGGGQSRSQDNWGPGYYPGYYDRMGYYSSGPVIVQNVQRPPIDRKTAALSANSGCTFFLLIASLIVTGWAYSFYGTKTIGLDVNTSRLVTAHAYFARNIRFTNKGEFEGPALYSFDREPHLNSEVKWSDYQNFTLNYWHQEYYYYLNKGSIVRMKSKVDIPEKFFVYFKVVRGEDDLQSFLERPDQASIRLRDYLEYKFEATENDDYLFTFANIHYVDAQVAYELEINSKQYDVRHAKKRCSLKSHCELELSLFGSRYAVLETPGVGQTPVDNWEVEVSYGFRWGPFVILFALIVLSYFVKRAIILRTNYDSYDTFAERAPLVAEAEGTSPTAPALPTSNYEQAAHAPHGKGTEVVDDHNQCSVCFDAPKDSFFVPCGHRATCFACGLRISSSEQATCPICRKPITDVNRIFDA
ncbi:hypothetical protein R1sor_016539 [Riccia sorocarpa]|uniref:RING-type domain-containing protein n=1 Tax=Riccia sorocarpa TaxID=122646 RepID=A0ABD3HJE0_9MARC